MSRIRSELGRALALVTVAALAGCGGSAHRSTGAGGRSASGATAATGGSASSSRARGSSGAAAGAGGGVEPVRAPAALTGRGGKVTPSSVHVPPYIAVQVTLASGDGRSYAVAVAGRRLAVGSMNRSASVALPGLRPGFAYVAKAQGGAAIEISASAEPGP